MTPKQQRIALATARGLQNIDDKDWWGWDFAGIEMPGDMPIMVKVPDYLEDLNAVREIEQELSDEQWLEYMLNLQDVLVRHPDRGKWIVCRENMSATAAQKTEAIVKTLGLWTK